MDKLTSRRKLILDLLAKSVAKIQAAGVKSEEEKMHVKSELKKVEDQQSNGKIKSSMKRKADNLDSADSKIKKLKMIKHEAIEAKIELVGGKVDHNMIKTEVVDAVKKETKIRRDKSRRKWLTEIPNAPVKVKTEYIEIKTENLDLYEKKCVKSDDMPELKVSLERKTNDRRSSEKSKCHKRVSGTRLRIFKPDEDQVLLDAMEQFGDQINYKELAKDLQRTTASIIYRVKKLKTGVSTKGHRVFTITEDMIILDAVLKHLNGQSLEKMILPQSEWIKIGAQIGRDEVSSRIRWCTRLRAWILQHYSGTLNLDIRRPLANYLAEKLVDMQSIDWSFFTTMSEFAGHTEKSLRFLFYNGIFKYAKINLKIQSEDITLEMVAEFANKTFIPGGKKVLGRTLRRQQEIIDYFECYVKSRNIKNFL